MFKFLRKYNKLLLAVFGVLLMITFLIPEAIQRWGQSAGAGATVATIDGRSLSAGEWHRVQREVQILERMNVSLPGVTGRQIKPEHWYLLTKEADEAGLVPTGQAIDLDDNSLNQFAQMTGERDAGLLRNTIAKLTGVGEMVRLFQSTGALSDRQLKHAADRLLSQVVAQIVVIKAQPDTGYQPSDEEIKSHFEKYADATSGDSEFGYRLPDRIKLEWLHISPEAVRESVRNSEAFSTMQQRLHWKRFENDPAKKFPKVESGPVPDAVKNDLLEQLTREKMDEVARFASDQLRLNRRGIPEKDGYVVLPADWDQRMLKFPQLAQDIQARFNITLPDYHSTGEQWKTMDEVAKLEGINAATTDRFGAVLNLRQLVENSKELKGAEAHTAAFVQKDVAGPPLNHFDGSVYIFRIIDADRARRPASLDEVREQVVADLQRVHDFKRLAESVSEIEQQAENEGVLALAIKHGTVVQPTATLSLANRFFLMQLAQQNMAPMLLPSSFPEIGQHRKTLDNVLEYALSLPGDKAVDALTEQERVFALPVEEKQAVLVFRVMQVNRLTQEDFAEVVRTGSIQQLATNEAAGSATTGSDLVNQVFGYEALAKRNNFAFVRETSSEADAENQPLETAAR